MSTKSPTTKRQWMRGLVSAALHGSAILTLTSVFCWSFLNERAIQLLPEVLADLSLRSDIGLKFLIITALAACTWALGNIIVALVRLRVKGQREPATVKLNRGTIITETLIVLPLFFLLTFGLAQMAINSMGGLLATVASYEAARTIAAWGPEVGHDRTGNGEVTVAIVEDRARIAAAGVLAPVVPSVTSGLCAPSNAMQETLTGMGGALLLTGVPAPQSSIWSMVDALDTQTFATRGYVKFLLAYCSITVKYQDSINTDPTINDRNTFETRMMYAHPNVMPMVGKIFRQPMPSGARPSTWATLNIAWYHKRYTLTQQLPPNPEAPSQNIVRKLISTLSSPL